MVIVDTRFILPLSHRNRTGALLTKKPPFITVHNTGNDNASALGHAKFLVNSPYLNRSWHFTVDDAAVFQHIPRNERAWHTGTTAGNSQSVGVEICQFTNSARHMKSENNGAWMVAYLMHSFGLKVDQVREYVITHQSWSGKYCPRQIIPTWNYFLGKVKRYLTELYGQEDVVAEVSWFKVHARDADVALITDLVNLCKVHGQVLIQEPVNPETSHLVRKLV